jgi:hypothetical protein
VANTSKTIVCSRQFADGSQCGKPVAPIFGAWPEECTSCASRVFATKDGFAAVEIILEEQYARLRQLTIAASIASNPWAAKDMHSRFTLLDKLAADIGSRRLMRRMSIARQLSSKKETAGRTTNEIRREGLGHRWANVPQEQALQLKQAGFKTRFIGVAWQVELS